MSKTEYGRGHDAPGSLRPFRSLFAKILICFWLALPLVSMALFLVTVTAESGPLFALWRRETGNTLALCGRMALSIFMRDGRSALLGFMNDLDHLPHSRIFLFDLDGNEISGRPTSPLAADMAVRTREGEKAVLRYSSGSFLVARSFMTSDGGRYVIVRETTGGLFRLFIVESGALGWKLLMVLLMGWGFCYWLARHLTAPLHRLQEATRRLAAGDLSVRVGKAAAMRGDEVAALSSDFDTMAERIEALMSAQRRLLGDVSHELRAPLARLNVALELARRTSHPGSAAPLDRIEVESQRLDALIGQVLYINRLESMSEPGQRVVFDLADMVGEIAVDADFEARSRNSAVRIIKSTPSTIKGMPDLVRSAVENVVRNAVAYAPQSTEIEISIHHERLGNLGYAVVEIRDHGPGAPEAALREIFRPFYRVADARERKTGGTGLGLAITERAVRIHGGLVRASNAPGGGLMVEIKIPLE